MSDETSRLSRRQAYDLAVRIGLSWREIRRGASIAPLREFLYDTDGESIEQGQMDTLDLLATRESWRMSELADALRVDPSTATRAVQRLEKDGLAQRRPSTADGRVVKVELTESGRAVYQRVFERRVVLLNHILSAYSPSELPLFAEMLERFVGAVDDFVESLSP